MRRCAGRIIIVQVWICQVLCWGGLRSFVTKNISIRLKSDSAPPPTNPISPEFARWKTIAERPISIPLPPFPSPLSSVRKSDASSISEEECRDVGDRLRDRCSELTQPLMDGFDHVWIGLWLWREPSLVFCCCSWTSAAMGQCRHKHVRY